jgi:predicted ATP-dependent endonuclease of OLD family
MNEQQPLRIVGLRAENFKRLRAVEITPKGDLVQITGKNAQGKTSVLDAVWAALGGKNQIPAKAVRKGSEKATIRLDLGEIIVTRTITEKGTDLTVESPDGARFKSPQTMLDAMMGALTFDPLAFTRMAPKVQAEQLRAIAKIDIDLDALDGLNRRDFELRTAATRDGKAARAAGEAIHETAIPAKIDTGALLDKMGEMQEQAGARQREEFKRQDEDRKIAEGETRADAIMEQIKGLSADLERVHEWLTKAKAAVAERTPLPEAVDAVELRAHIDRAEGHNRQADLITQQQAKRAEHLHTAANLEQRAQALTDLIEARNKQKSEAIAAAQMPVPGLGLQDGEVTYNGLPFEQASGAEQLRISTAIAMAANPRIRVIRISDGSLLDSDSLKLLAEMATQGDYQIWIEMVDSTGKVGISIEDGSVAADNQTEPVLDMGIFGAQP